MKTIKRITLILSLIFSSIITVQSQSVNMQITRIEDYDIKKDLSVIKTVNLQGHLQFGDFETEPSYFIISEDDEVRDFILLDVVDAIENQQGYSSIICLSKDPSLEGVIISIINKIDTDYLEVAFENSKRIYSFIGKII